MSHRPGGEKMLLERTSDEAAGLWNRMFFHAWENAGFGKRTGAGSA
jgi:hypothetical protein